MSKIIRETKSRKKAEKPNFINISKRDEDFKKILFVIKAIDDKSNQEFRNYIKITNDVIVSTDGKRIHIAETTLRIEDGFYKVIKKTGSEIILSKIIEDVWCPDIDPLFDKSNKENSMFPIENNMPVDQSVSYMFAKILRESDSILNITYLTDLFLIKPNYFDIYFKDKDTPVIFESYKIKAVIMPLRQD